jgi:hypothetical protein
MDDTVWLRCSACKKDIRYLAKHWVCSVSTCNRNRTKLVFCSVACWDSHVAFLRHRDSWAVEAVAPSKAAWAAELAAEADAGGPVTRQPPVKSVPASAVAPQPRPATSPGPAPVPTPSPGAPRAVVSPNPGGVPDKPAAATPQRAPVLAPPAPPAPPVEQRRVITAASAAPSPAAAAPAATTFSDTFDRDILIVVSKMKKYIKDRSGMNCSDAVADELSNHVRAICDDAIRAAGADGRKTVLDRDVPAVRRTIS